MRLTKAVAGIGLTVFFLCLAFGCTPSPGAENKEYTVLAAKDFAMWSALSSYQDASAPKNATVVFNGETYTGQYLRSDCLPPNTYVSHKYKGDHVYFDINADTGELAFIFFPHEYARNETKEEPACRQIADGIAQKYISLDEYQVSVQARTVNKNNHSYLYTYYKEISGYKTSDVLSIAVDGNGTIGNCGFLMLGAFKDKTDVVIDEDKAKEAVEKKIKALYASHLDSLTFDVHNKQLTKLDKGELAVLYTIDVSYTMKEPEQTYELQSGDEIFLVLMLT